MWGAVVKEMPQPCHQLVWRLPGSCRVQSDVLMWENVAVKQKQQGVDAFDTWYREQWGERWVALREALLQPVSQVAWWNPWFSGDPIQILGQDAQPSLQLPCCYETMSPVAPVCDAHGLLSHYWLDGASAVFSQLLTSQPHYRLLDLCAAPGGKTLQLIAAMNTTSSLVANELSKDRFHRLQRVLADYVLPSILEQQIRLTRHDATKWCLHEQSAYDWILLDAPCSSERHLLHQPQFLKDWSPARSKQLAQRQYTMLVSALEVVRVGGMVLYVTCSISPLECDGVMDKFHHKRKGRYEHVPLNLPWAESTTYGMYMLPDRCNWGPLFLSCVQRVV